MQQVYVIASLLTVAGYLALAALAWRAASQGVRTGIVAAACLTHAVWAASRFVEPFSAWLDPILLNGHVALWVTSILFLTGGLRSGGQRDPVRVGLVTVFATVFVAHTLVSIAQAVEPKPALLGLTSILNLLTLATAIVGLVGLVAAADEAHRWALKLVCFPLAASFGYGLYLETQALAFNFVPTEALGLRTIVDALAMLPVAVGLRRVTRLGDDLELSHRATAYAVTLIAVGLYLVATAACAWVLSLVAPSIPGAGQALGVILALTVLAVVLASGRLRATVKMLVARHLRRRKYDYYEEWRRFMRTLNEEVDTAPLEKRVIRACADPVEVPAGTLWWIPEGGSPQLTEMWHGRVGASVGPKLRPEHFGDADDRSVRVLQPRDLDQIAGGQDCDEMPAAAAVPLMHGPRVNAFILLARPRVGKACDDADRDLLLLIAHQCASNIREKWAATELARERQFARFARQYAFVAHDLKNVVSSLNVLAKNFERHGHKAAFRTEMQETLRQTTESLRHLLLRLDADGGEREEERVLNLLDSLRQAAAQTTPDTGPQAPTVRTFAGTRTSGPHVTAPPDRLQAVLVHLINNAVEATGDAGRVDTKVHLAGDEAIVEVTDDGCGMSQDFIRTELFEPFRSTKTDGFGIGSFQCQQFARERGGDVDVISTPGEGTTMRLRLPAVAPPTHANRELEATEGS